MQPSHQANTRDLASVLFHLVRRLHCFRSASRRIQRLGGSPGARTLDPRTPPPHLLIHHSDVYVSTLPLWLRVSLRMVTAFPLVDVPRVFTGTGQLLHVRLGLVGMQDSMVEWQYLSCVPSHPLANSPSVQLSLEWCPYAVEFCGCEV